MNNSLAKMFALKDITERLGNIVDTMDDMFFILHLAAAQQRRDFVDKLRFAIQIIVYKKALHTNALENDFSYIGIAVWLAIKLSQHTTDSNTSTLVCNSQHSIKHLSTNAFKVSINSFGAVFPQVFFNITFLVVEDSVKTSRLEILYLFLATS
jgi:hypothetical protein